MNVRAESVRLPLCARAVRPRRAHQLTSRTASPESAPPIWPAPPSSPRIRATYPCVSDDVLSSITRDKFGLLLVGFPDAQSVHVGAKFHSLNRLEEHVYACPLSLGPRAPKQ